MQKHIPTCHEFMPIHSYLCRRAISPTGILHGCCTLSSMGSFNAGLQILWTVRIENPAPSFCGSVGPPLGESFTCACTSIHSFVLFLLLWHWEVVHWLMHYLCFVRLEPAIAPCWEIVRSEPNTSKHCGLMILSSYDIIEWTTTTRLWVCYHF